MSLSNPNSIVTEQRLSEFYQSIYPYLGSGGESHVVYGFHISNSESVPSSKVTYLADAVGMTPAHMDYANDVFDYGSWANAFFMPKPCMLKYDGTVDYYLDPNDYTKKEDGTASDVANTSYAGNAMMEWGQNGKKIWLKIKPTTSDSNKSADVYIADYNVDGTYTCWPFHNSEGEQVDHFYTAIYNGSLVSSKLRSLSGQQVINKKTAAEEVTAATANNLTATEIWNLEKKCDIDLIDFLTILISKTTNSQEAFGTGLTDGGSESINNSFRTGVHNTKGLFYGTNSGTASTYTNSVKIFGMENRFGFQWRRYLGHACIKGAQKIKLTYGTEDGSDEEGFNLTGSGYVSIASSTPSGTNGDYIGEIKYTSRTKVPIYASSSATDSTSYCDSLWHNANIDTIPVIGGGSATGNKSGIFAMECHIAKETTSWNIGATISAKPLSS